MKYSPGDMYKAYQNKKHKMKHKLGGEFYGPYSPSYITGAKSGAPETMRAPHRSQFGNIPGGNSARQSYNNASNQFKGYGSWASGPAYKRNTKKSIRHKNNKKHKYGDVMQDSAPLRSPTVQSDPMSNTVSPIPSTSIFTQPRGMDNFAMGGETTPRFKGKKKNKTKKKVSMSPSATTARLKQASIAAYDSSPKGIRNNTLKNLPREIGRSMVKEFVPGASLIMKKGKKKKATVKKAEIFPGYGKSQYNNSIVGETINTVKKGVKNLFRSDPITEAKVKKANQDFKNRKLFKGKKKQKTKKKDFYSGYKKVLNSHFLDDPKATGTFLGVPKAVGVKATSTPKSGKSPLKYSQFKTTKKKMRCKQHNKMSCKVCEKGTKKHKWVFSNPFRARSTAQSPSPTAQFKSGLQNTKAMLDSI